MSYLVLARKWRPQNFEDLLGQEHVSQTLTNAITQGRLAHAFLFCGPRGVGKTSAARILAKILVCPKAKDAKSCNQCSICEDISKGISVDVMEIDGASNNGVDSIRELRDRAHYLPTQGQNKIYIIDEVHMLSQSAFNALLKILEEPPAHLKFIFATTEAHKIPATILSRCQRFDFKKVPLKLLHDHLTKIAQKEKIEIEKDASIKIAKEAKGSFRDALSLLDQMISYCGNQITLKSLQEILGSTHEETLFDLLETIFKKDSQALLGCLTQVYIKDPDVKQLALELLEYFRALLLIKISKADTMEKENFLDLTDHELSRLKTIAELASLEELEQAFNLMLRGIQDMAQTLYPRFVFEATLIKLLQLKPLVALEQLIERIESLSRGSSPIISASPTISTSPVPTFEKSPDKWMKVVDVIRAQKPSLAAILEHGYCVQWVNNKITLGFQKDSVFYKLMADKENISTFEKIVSEHFKTPTTLLVSDIPAHTDSGVKSLVQENEHQIDQMKKKALENEVVKEVQKVFDGKVIDVKVQK